MQVQNIIKSTSYIDTINKLDNLFNELLYSQDSGYIYMSSKEIIKNAQSIIDKFSYEADKIAKECDFCNFEQIINEKRQELISIVKTQCEKHAKIWAYEVFQQMIDNSLLSASINSNNIDFVKNIKNRLTSAINWICAIDNLSKDKRLMLISHTDKELSAAIKLKDTDFAVENNPLESDYDTFFKLRNLIINDLQKFMDTDPNKFKTKLSVNDINYFLKIKSRINSNKTAVIDEINLFDCAINELKLKNNKDKYDFIKQVMDDFKDTETKTEDEQIKIITRRMKLFTNKDEYYKKLLGF